MGVCGVPRAPNTENSGPGIRERPGFSLWSGSGPACTARGPRKGLNPPQAPPPVVLRHFPGCPGADGALGGGERVPGPSPGAPRHRQVSFRPPPPRQGASAQRLVPLVAPGDPYLATPFPKPPFPREVQGSSAAPQKVTGCRVRRTKVQPSALS